MDENLNIFEITIDGRLIAVVEITIAGRLFAIARELDDCNQFRQTYYVDDRRVPVQYYLELLTDAWNSRMPFGGRTTSANPDATRTDL